jgi:hypothetical protein
LYGIAQGVLYDLVVSRIDFFCIATMVARQFVQLGGIVELAPAVFAGEAKRLFEIRWLVLIHAWKLRIVQGF